METESVSRRLKIFSEDMRWLSEEYDMLAIKYANEWVATVNKNIIDHDKDLSKLMLKLENRYPGDSSNIAIKYITTEKAELIL